MKRNINPKYPPLKKGCYVAHSDEKCTKLVKIPASDEMMKEFTPKIHYGYTWEADVLTILMESYMIDDAYIDCMSTKLDGSRWHSTILHMRGRCPYHGYPHQHNHWILINTKGFSTTRFMCHHEGLIIKDIEHALPFPGDGMKRLMIHEDDLY